MQVSSVLSIFICDRKIQNFPNYCAEMSRNYIYLKFREMNMLWPQTTSNGFQKRY